MANSSSNTCPHCGGTILTGATRCVKCGKSTLTEEERMRAIDRAKASKRPSPLWGLLKCVLVLLAILAVYYGLVIGELLPSVTGPIQDFIGRILK